MNFKKSLQFSAALCFLSAIFVFNVFGQQRARVVVQNPQITQTNQPTDELVKKTIRSVPTNRPVLTNNIVVVGQTQNPQPLVKKTASATPSNTKSNYLSPNAVGRMNYASSTTSAMLNSIQGLYGIPYRYGSTGPNRYDCSGFVWAVFQRSGILFERSSAATYWHNFEPVSGDDRFKFGTLVFFNKLGHVGIVADENGFYHASSSKGITYSPFKGYWEKRIVGYRRIPAQN
jgi:cell wall-associated NlpC family hydrolase